MFPNLPIPVAAKGTGGEVRGGDPQAGGGGAPVGWSIFIEPQNFVGAGNKSYPLDFAGFAPVFLFSSPVRHTPGITPHSPLFARAAHQLLGAGENTFAPPLEPPIYVHLQRF